MDERPEQPFAEAPTAARGPRDAIERLDARVVAYWLVTGILSLVMLGMIGFGLLFGFGEGLGEAAGALWIVGFIVFGLLLAWALVSPSLAYARWRFLITSELLLARYGIIFHEEKTIPISRLQHVDLTRGPVERMFGLATLVVFTAGTEGASFRLPGLAVARAQELRDQILEARGDDVI